MQQTGGELGSAGPGGMGLGPGIPRGSEQVASAPPAWKNRAVDPASASHTAARTVEVWESKSRVFGEACPEVRRSWGEDGWRGSVCCRFVNIYIFCKRKGRGGE